MAARSHDDNVAIDAATSVFDEFMFFEHDTVSLLQTADHGQDGSEWTTSASVRQDVLVAAEDEEIDVAQWLAGGSQPRSLHCNPYDWTVVGEFETYDDAKDRAAPSSTRSSKIAPCKLCFGKGWHKMRVRYMDCTCRAGWLVECSKRFRIVWCEASKTAVLSKRGEYAECIPPDEARMSLRIRALADALFDVGVTPSQARHKLKSVVSAEEMPHVKQFQSRYRYYRLSTLQEHSKPDVMCRMLMESLFDVGGVETKFFSFGFEVVDGAPQVTFGGSAGTFKVGVTTKNLLRKMSRSPGSFVFHWDATYKIDSMAFPVLICGLTDPGGSFHPVAFFLISGESTKEYEWAMRALMKVYAAVVGMPLKLDYIMADAALAPIAAMKNLPQLGFKKLLMCFYHLVACVHKELGSVEPAAKALVMRHLLNMHFTRSRDQMDKTWREAIAAWSANNVLVAKGFIQYFEKQWIRGDCSNWQVSHTPTGFPTTNNPCELYNKHFKGANASRKNPDNLNLLLVGIYTQKSIHGLCATFLLLGSVAEGHSQYKPTDWKDFPSPSPRLMQRVKRLAAAQLLRVVPPEQDIGQGSSTTRILGVVPREAIRLAYAFEHEGSSNDDLLSELQGRGITTLPASDLELANAYYYNDSVNNVRHESIACDRPQPPCGWLVSTVPGNLSCECNYFFKFRYCCHLVYALQQQSKDMRGAPLPPKRCVRNGAKRSKAAPKFKGFRPSSGGRSVRGRRHVGPALALA